MNPKQAGKLEVGELDNTQCARIFTRAERPLSDKELKDFIIGIAQGTYELGIFLYGFIYKAGIGIYTIGPREELEKLRNPIEDFDFEKYIREYNDDDKTTRLFLYTFRDDGERVLSEMVK